MFAEVQHLTLDKALNFFYNSEVYQLMKDGISDMQCMSEKYLIEDLGMSIKRNATAIERIEPYLIHDTIIKV